MRNIACSNAKQMSTSLTPFVRPPALLPAKTRITIDTGKKASPNHTPALASRITQLQGSEDID